MSKTEATFLIVCFNYILMTNYDPTLYVKYNNESRVTLFLFFVDLAQT